MAQTSSNNSHDRDSTSDWLTSRNPIYHYKYFYIYKNLFFFFSLFWPNRLFSFFLGLQTLTWLFLVILSSKRLFCCFVFFLLQMVRMRKILNFRYGKTYKIVVGHSINMLESMWLTCNRVYIFKSFKQPPHFFLLTPFTFVANIW